MTTYERLREILLKDYDVPADKLTPTAVLEDLGIDSLGVLELMFNIEDEFKIDVPSEIADLNTIADTVKYIDQLVAAQVGSPAAAVREAKPAVQQAALLTAVRDRTSVSVS